MFLYVFYSSTPGFQLAKISTSRAFVDSQPIATGRSGWPGLPFPLARRRVAWAPPMANCDIIWVPKKKLLQNCPKSASYLKCHIDIPPHVRVLPFSHHNPNCTPWNVQLITKNVKLPVVSQLYLQVETISSMDVFPLEVYRYMKKINCLT
jgi:hypothetical protein